MNLKPYFKKFTAFFSSIIILSTIHWFSMLLYNKYCYDPTIFGILKNIFSIGSPFCMFFNKIQFNIAEYYIVYIMTICSLIITWISNMEF